MRDKKLRDIWLSSSAFQMYRGTQWMQEPCRTCEFREQDWGGCRCQAFAFTGDATLADPACHKSSFHSAFADVAAQEAKTAAPEFVFRSPRAAAR